MFGWSRAIQLWSNVRTAAFQCVQAPTLRQLLMKHNVHLSHFKNREYPGWNCPSWHTACYFFFSYKTKAFSLRSPTLCTTALNFIQLHVLLFSHLTPSFCFLNQQLWFVWSWFGRVANLSCTALEIKTTPPLSHAHALKFGCPGGNRIASVSLHHQILITCGETNTKLTLERAATLRHPPPLLTLPTPLVSLYRGAVKAPWAALVAALAAALAAAWRTAWLDMTPVANSAWAFWKLASVCLYRLCTWTREEQSTLTPDTCSSSSSYHAHCEGENDTQNLISWLFFRLFFHLLLASGLGEPPPAHSGLPVFAQTREKVQRMN